MEKVIKEGTFLIHELAIKLKKPIEKLTIDEITEDIYVLTERILPSKAKLLRLNTTLTKEMKWFRENTRNKQMDLDELKKATAPYTDKLKNKVTRREQLIHIWETNSKHLLYIEKELGSVVAALEKFRIAKKEVVAKQKSRIDTKYDIYKTRQN